MAIRRVSERAATPKPRLVATGELKPNPHNPRMLFDELPLKTLQASIKKVGILVPLTVYKAKGESQFTILDGQRRWICAERLKLPRVPINAVQEPTPAQNIITMFQIHKLRKDWELMPTALKLGVLMTELDERRDRTLAELTGLDAAVVTRCKKLLSYPVKYQNMMLFKEPSARIKADFFIELYVILTDRVLSSAAGFKRSLVTDSFLRKFRDRKSGMKSVTDFRKIKQYVSVAKAAGKENEIRRRFMLFLNDDSMLLSQLEIATAQVHSQAKRITKNAESLVESVQAIEVKRFLGEEDLWRGLERLLAALTKKLIDADRRLK